MKKPEGQSNVKLFAGIIIGAFASVVGIAIWRLILKHSIAKGTVQDAVTRVGIAGAEVILTGEDGLFARTFTDAAGVYTIDDAIKTSYIAEGYPYFYYYRIEVKAVGYQTHIEDNVTFHPAVNTLDVFMEAI